MSIFACNDESAIGVLQALIDEGIKVPEEVNVVGCDDIEIANLYRPSLTTIRTSFERQGTLAVEQLIRMIKEGEEGKNEIKVYIGEESPIQSMKDCSIVTANYEFGDGMRGMIGIIGPKRMDYDKVLKTMKSMTSQLESLFKKNKGDK